MAARNKTTNAVFRIIQERNGRAKDLALHEMGALRKDLSTLEAILKGKKPKGNFSPFDVVHGAFELFRHASTIFENQDMEASLEQGIEAARVEESLDKMGAQLLKKPEGWHWISPRGEMHFLAKAEETDKALEKLKDLRSPKKKKGAAPKAEAKEEQAGK